MHRDICKVAGLVLLFTTQTSAYAGVTYLKNGDRITGEIQDIWDNEVIIEPEIDDDAKVAISLDALPGRTYLAQVKEVGVAVTGAATTYLVTAQFLEGDIDIRAGMAAEVTFLFDVPESDHILVPLVAVGEDRDGRFVFVIEPSGEAQGTVHRRAVGMTSTARGVEIVDGLDEGELVVTAGVRRLVDGETVKLLGVEGTVE